MASDDSVFYIDHSFRVPGLGLLVLPTAPGPGWLAPLALHTALVVQLHWPGQPALVLPATVEELAHEPHPPTRALLLDADPGPLPAGAWLTLAEIATSELF
jgi:hypothetical protein